MNGNIIHKKIKEKTISKPRLIILFRIRFNAIGESDKYVWGSIDKIVDGFIFFDCGIGLMRCHALWNRKQLASPGMIHSIRALRRNQNHALLTMREKEDFCRWEMASCSIFR